LSYEWYRDWLEESFDDFEAAKGLFQLVSGVKFASSHIKLSRRLSKHYAPRI